MLEFKRITRDWFKIGLAAGLLSTIFSLLIGWLKLPLVNVTFSAIEVTSDRRWNREYPLILAQRS